MISLRSLPSPIHSVALLYFQDTVLVVLALLKALCGLK